MKLFDNTKPGIARQGDVAFIPVDEIPSTAVEAKTESGSYIVAHSETGHHHTIVKDRNVEFFEDSSDPLQGWLKVNGYNDYTEVKHNRSFHTHETIGLPPGNYSVRRQRRAAGEAWARVAD